MRAFAAAALLVLAAPTFAQDLSVRFLTIKSAALGEERTILVHLPPGHDPNRRAADAYRRGLELAKARGDGQEAFYTGRLQRIEAARAGRRHPDADKIGLPESSVYRCGGHDLEAPGVSDYRR